jgi:magnesium-protoporphyrin IX monomethyl ester (oxidative) cyclase
VSAQRPAATDVILVQMPWAHPGRPSIALGLLKAALAGAAIPAACRYLNLDFFDHLAAAGPALAPGPLLEALPHLGKTGLSMWAFAVPPLVGADRAALVDAWYEDGAAQLRAAAGRRPVERWLAALREIRAQVPAFLAQAAARLLAERPRVVGFTTSLDQLVPSLALARLLKDQDPSVRIVLGGTECRAELGVALHRAFPFVDAIVRGDGEALTPPLVRDLLAGRDPAPRPGLCVHAGGRPVATATADGQVPMAEVPAPDYDEYFARLGTSAVAGDVTPVLLYQASRGCWWGEHTQCLFCARDPSARPFRVQTAARMAADLRALAARHGLTRLEIVDDNLDPDTVAGALGTLAAEGLELQVGWCQSHPTLSRDEIARLRAAGVTAMFVGVESLSTNVLAAVHKGTTALSSVRFLRWCAEVGLSVRWNLLYGFPGEAPADYERMAQHMRSLTHLAPPYRPVRADLRRFSPHFEAPARFGIEILGPAARHRWFAACTDAPAADLALSFDYRIAGQGDPAAHAASCVAAYQTWLQARARGSRLTWERCGPAVRIVDRRVNLPGGDHLLEGLAAEVYLACQDGAAAADLQRGAGARAAAVAGILDDLVARRVVLEDHGKYLTLALPAAAEPA